MSGMKNALIICLLAGLATCGCMRYIISEPLPALVRRPVDIAALPRKAAAAIHAIEPDAKILKVVGWEFRGKFNQYDVSVATPHGNRMYCVTPDGKDCQLRKEPEPGQGWLSK